MTAQDRKTEPSTAAHTKGPWHSEQRFGGANGTRIIGADGTHIATVTRKADKPISQKQADISLILAAPDMLAALQAIFANDNAPLWFTADAWAQKLCDDARAAIARVGGQEQTRACTCHPDDNPPRPCPQKYALSECRAIAAIAAATGDA